MIRAIYLDATPLSLVTQRKKKNPLIEAAHNWLEELIRQDIDVYIPEIIDYEIRRELVRAKKQAGIERLNEWQLT